MNDRQEKIRNQLRFSETVAELNEESVRIAETEKQ